MFDFSSIHLAESVDDAIAALVRQPDAVLIAGGTDVLIQLREGRLAGRGLVSIHGLAELAGVSMDAGGTLHIGPLTSFAQVTHDPLLLRHFPVLCEAADQVGGPQTRAAGTIGGNVCNGMTSADTASTLVAAEAVLTVKGTEGTRVIPISAWYQGPGKTVLRHGEVLIDIAIPKDSYDGVSGHYIKFAQRNAMDIATLGVACLCRLSPDRSAVARVRLAFGVAGPVPMRAPSAEAAVAGLPLAQAVAALGEAALLDVNPRNSWRASRDFRIQLTRELPGRALAEAIRKGGGQL